MKIQLHYIGSAEMSSSVGSAYIKNIWASEPQKEQIKGCLGGGLWSPSASS